MNKQYVISAELDRLDPDWIDMSALARFRENLEADLNGMGKSPLWVSSNTIQSGLKRKIEVSGLPVVSLDDKYVEAADLYLGFSRGVDQRLIDTGYVPRVGYRPIANQIDAILPKLGTEIILVDDVVYSGNMIAWLVDELAKQGVTAKSVICGIAIDEGIDNVAALGIDIDPVISFCNVDDEICERDFAVVPGSGRRIAELAANALYFDNVYGRPTDWASIPAKYAAAFCVNSLERNIQLLKPNIPMQRVGTIFGYEQDGTVREQIYNRLEAQK